MKKKNRLFKECVENEQGSTLSEEKTSNLFSSRLHKQLPSGDTTTTTHCERIRGKEKWTRPDDH